MRCSVPPWAAGVGSSVGSWRPWWATGVTELATAAQVSGRTRYQHFAGKEAIIASSPPTSANLTAEQVGAPSARVVLYGLVHQQVANRA